MRSHRPPRPELVEESPVFFRPSLAAAVGVAGAILLERIWQLAHSRSARRRQHDGRVFVFYPVRSTTEDLPFLRRRTVRRALAKLVADGLLSRARSKDGGHGKAAWFAVRKEAVDALGSLFPAAGTTPPGHAHKQRRRNDAATE